MIILRYKAVPFIKMIFTHGLTMDIHKEQAGTAGTAEHRRMMAIYERAKQYPNETEACYSFVQVLTACVNCESPFRNSQAWPDPAALLALVRPL